MEPLNPPGGLLPTSKFNLGLDFLWNMRFDCKHMSACHHLDLTKFPICIVYKKCKSETISIIPWLIGKPNVYTSNLDVARQVVAGGIKSQWIKPEDASRIFL